MKKSSELPKNNLEFDEYFEDHNISGLLNTTNQPLNQSKQNSIGILKMIAQSENDIKNNRISSQKNIFLKILKKISKS